MEKKQEPTDNVNEDFLSKIDSMSEMERKNMLTRLYFENYKLRNENFIKLISEHSEPLINLIKETSEKWLKFKKSSVTHSILMSILAILVVFLIVGISGYLTSQGKIDGSTFTFLLGLIVGYVLTFIRDSIGFD